MRASVAASRPGGSGPRCVLMTADTVGGVFTYVVDLARELAQRGTLVHLATMGPRADASQRAILAGVGGLVLHESDFRLEWMDDPWTDVRAAGGWLRDLEDRVRPDVVHLNGFAHGALRWRAPVVMVVHSCVLSWWRAVNGEDAPPAWDRYREVVRRGLQAADVVVAPTRAMLDEAALLYGPFSRTRVVPNGLEPRGMTAVPKEPFVFCAGRLWDEAKGIATLAAAAEGLAWPVVVAGDDRGPDGRSRPPAGVRALGRLEPSEVAAWMGRAAVYALPARYEPFGLSALEAAQCGCALVLSDIPSLREVWGDAAWFVPPGDAAAWRSALQRLTREDDTREELAARARERSRRYDVASFAGGYGRAYAAAAVAGRRRKTRGTEEREHV